MKIYFAHPVSDYGSLREKECLEQIQKHFPGAEILNPNQDVHNEAYLTEGMAYFERLVMACDCVVAAPFADGEWGMGVFREAETVSRKGGKVFELHKSLREIDIKDIRPLSINETKRRVREEKERLKK